MIPRALTAQERAVLDAAVEVDVSDPSDAAALHDQIAVAEVTGLSCSCGCPSYALRVPDGAAPARVSEFSADVDGGGLRVTLDGGHLADVEVYWYGDEPVTEWPAADEIR